MTSRDLLFASLLSSAALLGWSDPRPAARRLRGLPRPARPPATSPVRPRPGIDLARLGAGLGGLTVLLLIGNWFGLLVGLAAAVGLDRVLRRLPLPADRRQRQAAAELPLAADLLAVVLRSGAPVDQAVGAVAQALAGPLGDQLGRVAQALALGATPADAWQELAPVAGAGRLVRTAVRGAEHGSAMAGALLRLADDLRADRAIAAEAAARRAGVLIVLPLGLCFLPAFILAGLMPVIVAVLGDVLP